MYTSTNDKRHKYGKRVRFAIDNYIELPNRIGRIDELYSKHKDCHLNNLNINEIDTMQNIKIQSKMLCFDRYSDNDVDCIPKYPSKHRHLSFNRCNHTESQKNIFNCNATKKYPLFKNIINIIKEDENLVEFEGQLPRVTLSKEHSILENDIKIDEMKFRKEVLATDSIEKNNNNSRNKYNTTTLAFDIKPSTSFEYNGSIGSKPFEENYSASILNITKVKSNLDRIIKRYRMKQKET